MHNKRAVAALLAGAGLVAGACGSSTKTTSPTTASASGSSTTAASATTVATPGTTTASGSATQFPKDYSAMASLKSAASAGSGSIAVILPDTVSSARYTEFDAPDLQQAFQAAGLSSSDFTIKNAQGSDSTELTDAQSAITAGASVLVVDPLDSGVGAQIESYAKSHGVPVIDYDRLTLGGSRDYYVSFDNVKVGNLMGQGLIDCASAWGVSSPQVIVMRGAATDNNATLFAQGYEATLAPKFSSGGWKQIAQPAGTWDPPTAATEFQQAFTANPSANAVLVPNDGNAAPVIKFLQTQHIGAKKFPTTGQDATLDGLQNILTGYQCGTVYKPIYQEAQAAASLAIYLRAKQSAPSTLVNGTSQDTQNNSSVPSVLLTPIWVTTANMKDTVIADNWVTKDKLCTGDAASACPSAGIS